MRLLALTILCSLPALPALAQQAPPLPPYTPAPTTSPLAPLPGDTTAAGDDKPTGQVRATSDTSSNISAADTRSNIAPALPTPDANGDTPQAFLMAARQALQANRTGEAQEALERAESRALSRDVAPSQADTPLADPLVQQIGTARQALSVGNTAAALQAIDGALRQ
jgi:hypothetical protein